MEIAVTLSSARLEDADVAFMVAAIDEQLVGAAKDWGAEPCAVSFYAKGALLSPRTTHLMDIVDDIGVPGASGFHDDLAGVVYGKVSAQSVVDTGITLSHECLEMLADPTATGWAGDVALEIADPCEADCYAVNATIMGETRSVLVSNYVLPAWFDPTASHGPYDHMGKISAPRALSPGGYVILRDASGNTRTVFASHVPQTFGRKLGNAASRTMRRLKSRAPCPPAVEAVR